MDDEKIVPEDVVDDDKEVTEDDLRALKEGDEGVETSTDEDEPEKPEEDKETTEETEEEEPSFVKEFPNIKGDTPEEYAKNLEIAYGKSFEEVKRIQAEGLKPKEDTEDEPAVFDPSNVTQLYAKQKMDEEIVQAYTKFSKQYPQVSDESEYAKFTNEVATLSQTILQSQKRLASPEELYQKAAVILGWEPNVVTDKDKLDTAVKDSAASSRTSTTTKTKTTSKVTDAEIQMAKTMGGWTEGKTDVEIRKELEAVT